MRATFIKKRQMAARSFLLVSLRPLLAGSLVITLISVAFAQSLVATLAPQVEAITASVMGRAPEEKRRERDLGDRERRLGGADNHVNSSVPGPVA